MGRARYRSKLEVFRDLLVATRHASKKTRIIGLANLNPSTFQKHMALARAGGLVTLDDGEYQLTEKADRVLAALQELMARSNQVDITIQFLEKSGFPPAAHRWAEGAVLRQVSRLEWTDRPRPDARDSSPFARAGGMSSSPAGNHGSDRTDKRMSSVLGSSNPLPIPMSRPGRRPSPPSGLPEEESPSQRALRSHS